MLATDPHSQNCFSRVLLRVHVVQSLYRKFGLDTYYFYSVLCCMLALRRVGRGISSSARGHRSHHNVLHLIRPFSCARTWKRVDSYPSSLSSSSSPHLFVLPRLQQHKNFHLSIPLQMGSLENITKSLAGLSITPAATVEHAPASSPAAWREALGGKPSVPGSFELIKTIVYKPKTAKTATPVPLVVIAREGTDVISGALGKKLGLKDLRLASEDLLTEFFSLDKNSRTSMKALYVSHFCLNLPSPSSAMR